MEGTGASVDSRNNILPGEKSRSGRGAEALLYPSPNAAISVRLSDLVVGLLPAPLSPTRTAEPSIIDVSRTVERCIFFDESFERAAVLGKGDGKAQRE